MDTIEIASLLVEGVRLDFPSEKQMAALAFAWGDGANHQISFLRTSDFLNAQKVSEYASMIASSDLVLPESEALANKARAAAGPSCGMKTRRSVPIPLQQQEYLSFFSPLNEDVVEFGSYSPLKTLAVFLSALEQRRGSAFLIGGNLPSLQKAELNVRSTFPDLRVVGRSPGTYKEKDKASLMLALQKSTPDMVIVGSLLEDAELWISRHMCYTRSGIFFFKDSIIETLAGHR